MDVFASVKAFVAVADKGGFAKAAREAGAATSSIMRQVDALEEHLGTILLNRSTRSVTLTPAGEAYYAQVVRIVSDVDEANRCERTARSAAGSATREPTGGVRALTCRPDCA